MSKYHIYVYSTEPDIWLKAQAGASVYRVTPGLYKPNELVKVTSLYLPKASSRADGINQAVIQTLEEIPKGGAVKIKLPEGKFVNRLRRAVNAHEFKESRGLVIRYHNNAVKGVKLVELKQLAEDAQRRRGSIVCDI